MLSYNIWNSLNESAQKEYRYITSHGIGPGTLPNNVYVRSEDLENGKTAIYTNRPLSDEELKKYDIKPEWVQEGTSKKYTIYVTSGGDGVYNTRVYDVVDSEEQASDIVSELSAMGYGASYEETESSDGLKEDAWSDNFTISIIQKDGVYWKRKSDGKEIKTSFDVFSNPTDPTEWKTEDELKQYELNEGLKEDGYKSDSMKYSYNNNYVDISSLRKYSSYLDSISSVLDDSDFYNVYLYLASDEFSDAIDSFMDALVNEDVRIDSEMKSIENNLVNKK